MWRGSCTQSPGGREKREKRRNGGIKSEKKFWVLIGTADPHFFFAALGFKKNYFPVNLYVKSVIYRQRQDIYVLSLMTRYGTAVKDKTPLNPNSSMLPSTEGSTCSATTYSGFTRSACLVATEARKALDRDDYYRDSPMDLL